MTLALPASFYQRDVLEVAPELLNKVLVHGELSGRIVEVEAYRGNDDPASHAYRGLTPRTTVMFGPPGRLYTYFTYGMHWCANVVCCEDGSPGAVLLRSLVPLTGVEIMRERRVAARRDVDLCNGPAKLCQAFRLNGDHNGASLQTGPTIVTDGSTPPKLPLRAARVGISDGRDLLWRFAVPDNGHVSRPLP